jgi:hypothetical protein
MNAVIVLSAGLVGVSCPTHAEPEPTKDFSLASRSAHEAVKLPEFVPVINFDQFLLAYQQEAPGASDGVAPAARAAAEAISARFAPPSPEAQFLHVAQRDPIAPNVLDAAKDPKVPGRMASLAGVEGTSLREDAIDPKKADFLIPSSQSAAAEKGETSHRAHVRTPHRSLVAQASSGAKRSAHHDRRRVVSVTVSPRSGPAYTGSGPDLDQLVGFGTLTADNRLSN